MSKKTKPDENVKTISFSREMMADLLFVLKPIKEKHMEYLFWLNELEQIKQEILKNQTIDPTKWNCNWNESFATGKLVCTKIPAPKKEAEKKNGKS